MAETEGKKVLLIEDEKFLSNILKLKLERAGFSVLQAYDGEEGLQIIKEQNPSLVILDLVMPKMSGFELLERMSMDPQIAKIPVVVASNLGQESDMEKAKRLGAVDYYVKAQTSVDQLVEIFKHLIETQSP